MTFLALIDTDSGEVYPVSATSLLESSELLPLGEADTSDLAKFIDNVIELGHIASEARGMVSDELVARLDANACWTLRVDGWQLKTASPAAGSVSYDVSQLRAALETLVADGVISRAAAWGAVEPVRATVTVPYRLLRDVLRALDGYEVAEPIFDEIERIVLGEPEPTYKLRLAGVKALLKIRAARDVIEACEVSVTPPRRTVQVTRA